MKNLNQHEFRLFLNAHPENGNAYPDCKLNMPYDIPFTEFKLLEKVTITFNNYREFYLFKHPITNEIFLGDLNLGGHVARCRLIKITRSSIFEQPNDLLEWYENYSKKMWY